MDIREYKSKPRKVTAIRVHEDNVKEVLEFCGQFCMIKLGEKFIRLNTSSDTWERAYPGDVIIRSPIGDYYLSMFDCFCENYELGDLQDWREPMVFDHKEKRVIGIKYDPNEAVVLSALIRTMSKVGNTMKMAGPDMKWRISRPNDGNDRGDYYWELERGDMIVFNGIGFYSLKPWKFNPNYTEC